MLGTILTHALRDQALEDAKVDLTQYTNGVLNSELLRDSKLVIRRRLPEVIDRDLSARPDIVSVKVWRADGVLAWTNVAPERIGKRFPAGHHLEEVVETGQAEAEFEELGEAEDAAEAGLGFDNVVEVYAPIRAGRKVVGAYEIYANSSTIEHSIANGKRTIWFATLGPTLKRQRPKGKAKPTAAKARRRARRQGEGQGQGERGERAAWPTTASCSRSTDVTESSASSQDRAGRFHLHALRNSLRQIHRAARRRRRDRAHRRRAAADQRSQDRRRLSQRRRRPGRHALSHLHQLHARHRPQRAHQARGTETPATSSFLAKAPGGDQLFVRVVKGGVPGEPIAVTETGCDIYKSAVAVAGDGTAWIFWSQNKNYKPFPNNPHGQFRHLGPPAEGRQARRGGADFRRRPKTTSGPSPRPIPPATSGSPGKARATASSKFSPAARTATVGPPSKSSARNRAAAGPPPSADPAAGGGKVAIAWDTYEKGDYDVWLREFDSAGKAGEARPAANTDDYEARPAITYDSKARCGSPTKKAAPTWGKDLSGGARLSSATASASIAIGRSASPC